MKHFQVFHQEIVLLQRFTKSKTRVNDNIVDKVFV